MYIPCILAELRLFTFLTENEHAIFLNKSHKLTVKFQKGYNSGFMYLLCTSQI